MFHRSSPKSSAFMPSRNATKFSRLLSPSARKATNFIAERRVITDSVLAWFPVELLLKIFYLSIPETLEDAASFMDLRASPWSVSQVCRLWREVAVSEAGLWTMIIVDMVSAATCHSTPSASGLQAAFSRYVGSSQSPVDAYYKCMLHRLDLMLFRSRNCAIELRIVDCDLPTPLSSIRRQNWPRFKREIGGRLVAHATRVFLLKMPTAGDIGIWFWSDERQVIWRRLERLTVAGRVDRDQDYRQAPRLHTVEIPIHLLGEVSLPWKQMTHVTLTNTADPKIGQLAFVLLTIGMLKDHVESLELRIEDPLKDDVSNLDEVEQVLPRLRSLSIITPRRPAFSDGLWGVEGVLQTTRAPALKTLAVGDCKLDVLADFVLRCNERPDGTSGLRALTLGHGLFDQSDRKLLLVLLKRVPRLHELSMYNVAKNHIVFNMLTDMSLLPRMRELSITGLEIQKHVEKIARERVPFGLMKVYLREKPIAGIRALAQQGLVVESLKRASPHLNPPSSYY